MDVDWNKVAVHLNGEAWKEFESQNQTEDQLRCMEHRIRGFILKSLADALFEGIGDEAR
jgi:hypothetical protein